MINDTNPQIPVCSLSPTAARNVVRSSMSELCPIDVDQPTLSDVSADPGADLSADLSAVARLSKLVRFGLSRPVLSLSQQMLSESNVRPPMP